MNQLPVLQSVSVLPAIEVPHPSLGARTVSELKRFKLANIAPWLLVLVGFIYALSLNRYPTFYVDESFFGYPAARAAAGGPFAYQVGTTAPYAGLLWAYHGPLLPRLLELLFKVFGFSTFLSRLPNFLGAWLAALLIVLHLNRKGYRYAGFLFALLWCGDRTIQEVMYCRMEGLALLWVVLAYLCVNRVWDLQYFEDRWNSKLTIAAVGSGFFCGLAALTHPLCGLFTLPALLWVIYFGGKKAGAWFLGGELTSLPLLAALWGFHIHEGMSQFLWHARLQETHLLSSVVQMIEVLRWSRYWFLTLVLFTVVAAAMAGVGLVRRRTTPGFLDFTIALSFGLVALKITFGAQTHPYYIAYFAVWPMIALVTAVEMRWRQMRVMFLGMMLVWLSSAAWNLMRLREAFLFHRALSVAYVSNVLHRDVPMSANLIVTPELYALPIDAGHAHYGLTIWEHEHQDVCASCYVLMTAPDFTSGDYVARTNMEQRSVLYNGPAFPGSGPLDTRIVLLSPKNGRALLASASRTTASDR